MSKEELLELLKKLLQDALHSIQDRDKEELNEEQKKELKDDIEKVFMQALLDKGKPKEILSKVLQNKDEFLETFSPWPKKEDEDSGLIKEFVNSINNPDSNNDFSWLDILDTDKQWMEQDDKETKKEIKNKSKHVNMRYQIPTHFHGNIDNAVIFHCMENPRGYLGEYEDSDIDKGLECTDLVEYFGKTYKLLNKDTSSKKSVEKIQSILKDYSRDDMPDTKDIIRERYKLDKIEDEKEITNIIYSDKSNLSRELDNMFAEEEEFFDEKHPLKKNNKNKKEPLSEKYYYMAQYYAQLLEIDGKNMIKLKDKPRCENTEGRKKARKIAEKICNLEIYPFSCKDPKLGNDGIGEKILLNSDLSRLGAYIVLRRIYKYLVNENPQKPLFVFRKYDRAWEKLFNRIFKEVGVEDKFLQYLESHFFYCQTGQQGGCITSGNVISVHDFKALENIYKKLKELAFTEIFNLITEKED